MIKKIVPLSTLYFILSTASASAAGLVPCGGPGEGACNWCFFGQLFKNLIDFAMYIIFPLAAVMIVVGGILIMISGGSSDRFSKGKEMITAAVIGIIIALLSWIIIDTIIKMVAVGWSGISIFPWHRVDFGC